MNPIYFPTTLPYQGCDTVNGLRGRSGLVLGVKILEDLSNFFSASSAVYYVLYRTLSGELDKKYLHIYCATKRGFFPLQRINSVSSCSQMAPPAREERKIRHEQNGILAEGIVTFAKSSAKNCNVLNLIWLWKKRLFPKKYFLLSGRPLRPGFKRLWEVGK